MGLRQLGLQRDRLLVQADGSLQIALERMGDPQVSIGLGIGRIRGNGLLVGGDATVEIPLPTIGHPQVVVGFGHARCQPGQVFLGVYVR